MLQAFLVSTLLRTWFHACRHPFPQSEPAFRGLLRYAFTKCGVAPWATRDHVIHNVAGVIIKVQYLGIRKWSPNPSQSPDLLPGAFSRDEFNNEGVSRVKWGCYLPIFEKAKSLGV